MSTRIPKFVVVSLILAVVGLIFTGLVAWSFGEYTDREEARDCQRSVDYREDNRRVWQYVIDNSDPSEQAGFQAVLDELLPELKCDDGDPVPVK